MGIKPFHAVLCVMYDQVSQIMPFLMHPISIPSHPTPSLPSVPSHPIPSLFPSPLYPPSISPLLTTSPPLTSPPTPSYRPSSASHTHKTPLSLYDYPLDILKEKDGSVISLTSLTSDRGYSSKHSSGSTSPRVGSESNLLDDSSEQVWALSGRV